MYSWRVAALVVSLASLNGSACAGTSRQTVVRHFTTADQTEGRYQYVPFDVHTGTGTLRIAYQYDRADGENVIDLGLFEPGSLDLGTPAFRGYSGGARSSVVLSADTTTPGYRPGPLPAGRWHVLLGLYKVGPAGVDVSITMETEPGPAPSAPRMVAAPSPAAPATESARWYSGALHTHTLHSDGTIAPRELVQLVRAAGLDFVAITDHNNTTHRYELGPELADQPSPLWIVGEEVTTPGGHASVWGLDDGEWVDFRVRPEERRIGELVATARGYGAVFSINHPASQCVACGWTHEIVDGIEGIEISNGRHGEQEGAVAIWDDLLRHGRRLTAVASSDWHGAPNAPDVDHVRVHAASLTTEGVLTAIRHGRVIIMRNARAATPQIVVRAGARSAGVGDSLAVAPDAPLAIEVRAAGAGRGRLVLVSSAGHETLPLDDNGHARLARRAQSDFLRFELFAADGSPFAVTNPVYLTRP